ncbi:hypothetical protein DRB89_30475 [Streptomyces sp. ICC4]|nr:hypothetical protein DRB89_30475 [Streptomyces sp. ICC4]
MRESLRPAFGGPCLQGGEGRAGALAGVGRSVIYASGRPRDGGSSPYAATAERSGRSRRVSRVGALGPDGGHVTLIMKISGIE